MIYPLAGNGQATHHSMLSDPASQTSEPVLKPSFYSTFMDTTPTRPLIFSKPPSSLTPEKPSVITGGIQDKPKPIELKSPILKEPKPTATQSTSFYDWEGTWTNLREEQTGARFAPSMTLLPLDKTVLTSGGILSPDPTKPIEPSTKQPVTKNTDPKNPQPSTTAISPEKGVALDAQTWLKEFGGSVTAPNLVGTDADIVEKFKIHAPLPTEIEEQPEVIELVRDKTPHRRSDGSIFNMLIPAAEASTGGYQDDWLAEQDSLASPFFIEESREFCENIYETDKFKFTSLVAGHENIVWNTLHAFARPMAGLLDLTKDSFENFDGMTPEQAIQNSETIATAIREAPSVLKQSLYNIYSEFSASSPEKQGKMLLNALSSFFIPTSLVEAYDSFKAGDIKGGLEITFEFAGSFVAFGAAGKGIVLTQKATRTLAEEIALTTYGTNLQKGINPFKGKTFEEIDKILIARGFTKVGPDPASGKGAYFHPETGRKYYLDKGGVYKEGIELPHVDVHRMENGINLEKVGKKRYPLGEGLIEENVEKRGPNVNF